MGRAPLAHLRCIGCETLGRLQYKSKKMVAGRFVFALKCKECGRYNHAPAEKLGLRLPYEDE